MERREPESFDDRGAARADSRRVLRRSGRLADSFLSNLDQRPVGSAASHEELVRRLGGPLPEGSTDPEEVVARLARDVDDALVAMAGPRYFGFVIGGGVPAAVGADWLTSVWDQNAALFATSPAAATVEEVAGRWLAELLGLPETVSFGFVSGCQMANFTALAAARHAVLKRVGWDVERDGLTSAPRVHVVAGAEAHATVFTALAFLGLGRDRVRRVPTDDQGRMRPAELARVLSVCTGPTIVCAQAGNVNTGSFDPLSEVADLAQKHEAWLHVDGAFGLWTAASRKLRHLAKGAERADSWATDAHKWLNVPYDSGIVFVAHPEAHRAAMTVSGAYFVEASRSERDPHAWVPESSRRARGFTVYAALRSLGRSGVESLVDTYCRLAQRMADRLRADARLEVINDVVLNQVLVGWRSTSKGDPAAALRRVVEQVQADGTCWLAATIWQGRPAIRISVSNWSTTAADIDRSAAAILRALES